VASLNTKDYYNLIHVYLDAVLSPRAVTDPNVLKQEGWHYELQDVQDDLKYKGVVYNEMKGVYSSPDSVLGRESMRSLYSLHASDDTASDDTARDDTASDDTASDDTASDQQPKQSIYSIDSGGDPEAIVGLSFDEYVDYYNKTYVPENAKIYFYGDDDLHERLVLVDEYLKGYVKKGMGDKTAIDYHQLRNTGGVVRKDIFYPVTDSEGGTGEDAGDDNKCYQTTNWLLHSEPLSSYQSLTLNILDHLLLGTTSSILHKTLTECGYGESITGGGLSDELLQASYSVGMKGVKEEDVEKVISLIDATLLSIVEGKGFDNDAVLASMNTLEFQLREFNTGSFPKGLSMILAANGKWNYDVSPEKGIEFEEDLVRLKEEVAANGGKVFVDMLRSMLVENKHKTVVVMRPDASLEQKTVKDEKDRLKVIKDSMTEDELHKIVNETKLLKELQAKEDSAEDIATIPSLTLKDIERDVKEYPIKVTSNYRNTGVQLVENEMPSTSGILYVNFAVDVSDVTLDDAPLISIVTRLMQEAGTSQLSDVEMSRKIGTYTGGVSVSSDKIPVLPRDESTHNTVKEGDMMLTKVFFKGKATKERGSELFDIFDMMLNDAKLDSQSKVVEMLKERKSRVESGIQSSGHSYAQLRLRARYSVGAYMDEYFGGISALPRLKALLIMAENDWDAMRAKLFSIRDTMLAQSKCRDGMVMNVIGDEATLKATRGSMDSFIESLPGDAAVGESAKFQDFYSVPHPWAVEAKKRMAKEALLEDTNEGFVVPTQVSYVGSGGRLYQVGEVTTGASTVVSRHLKTGYLWDTVRVIGGAYGGFCTFGPGSGLFTYLSYRDPNLAGTLDAYDAAADALLEQAENLTEEQLATSIIGTIGDLDGAMSPSQKGSAQFMRWLQNESAEERQRYRDEVLGTKKQDFVDFAKRLKSMKRTTSVVSSRAQIEEAIKAGKAMDIVDVL
jgi:Zn-dependent M16 (insulinase) family peptidase